jgi:hypothetical protein
MVCNVDGHRQDSPVKPENDGQGGGGLVFVVFVVIAV